MHARPRLQSVDSDTALDAAVLRCCGASATAASSLFEHCARRLVPAWVTRCLW